jgi:hypothetical protein
MAIAQVQGSRRMRSLTLALGLLVAAGLTLLANRGAEAKDPPKAAPAAAFVPEQVRKINEFIAAQWKANNLKPSARASDYDFVRRASLDIIGRIATALEVRQFMADPAPTRRTLLIERLLQSDEYARNWGSIWTVWLMTRSANRKYQDEMSLWLEEQFANQDQGFDKIVTDLLTATGKNSENGATNFILSHLGEPIPGAKHSEEGYFDFVPLTSRTTRLFLGKQVQCTQCHNHPFNTGKQSEFWGINAFFRQVRGERPPARGGMMVAPVLTLAEDKSVNPDSTVFFEQRNGLVKLATPMFLDGTKMKQVAKPGQGRREVLADLILKSDDFPKAYINRMWGHFFGRGLTQQGTIDDMGAHNPVTHPELLEYLAKEFKDYQFKPRDVIRWICNSDAYGLSSVANSTNSKSDDELFYSRMLLKSLSPEQLFESLMVATQAERDETKDNKKKLRDEWMKNLIVNFGDDEGNEVTFNGTVVQALLLMNGKEINDAIGSKEKGTIVQALTRKGRTQGSILEDLYLAALNRKPTSMEAVKLHAEIERARGPKSKTKDIVEVWQDLFWGLLNSNEFILNH